MFKPMKVVKGYLSWMSVRYSGLLGGFRLLGDSLGGVVGGEVDFKVMDGFEVDLEDEFTLLLVNVKGLGGAGALREPIDKQVFPSDIKS